jgi:polysaccharide deacetylase family protein (PEP-CTERM system associated)
MHKANSHVQFEHLDDRYRGNDLPNAMTVDVEDYFQVSAFDTIVSRRDWDKMPSRLEHNVDRILALFDEHDTKATFFTLGWVAEHRPGVVRRIAAEGHEIASHGYEHTRVTNLDRKQFVKDVTRTRKILEDVGGNSVVGYRAPSFSIGAETLWALDGLLEAGYQYSSSIFPISHDHYGLPAAPRFPFYVAGNSLLEVPLSTLPMFGRNWPCAGGGYFRLLPLSYSSWALSRINRKELMPAVFYFHPWELDPGQPKIDRLSAKTKFRHYVNLSRFEYRLTEMLKRFRWSTLERVYLGKV